MRSWKTPTPEQVDRAVALLAHAEHYRYFFDRLENPEWLNPLWERGFFRHPPRAKRNNEEGTIHFLPWPEAHYLARMACHKPELVAEIIQQMEDTDNASVILNLVDALLSMSPDVSARFVEKTEGWAESPYLLLPQKLGQLFSQWAKGGRIEEALRLARILLDVLPDERRPLKPDPYNSRYRLPPEPRARFHTWLYKQILEKHYPALVRETGLSALNLLCDLLDKAVELSRLSEDDQSFQDYSYIWRPAVEDHPQNQDDTIKDILVTGVRDAAELIVRFRKTTIQKVVDVLENRRWKIFRRIVLHILRVFPNQAKTLAAVRLMNRSLFNDVGLRHEYVLLLRECFPHLTLEDQTKILRWIEEGPEIDRWNLPRKSHTGQQPSKKDEARYLEVWQRDRLVWIGPENLPADWRDRYNMFLEKYGMPDHPEFPVYMESSWMGPDSPKTADELKVMSVKEIAKFLKSWEPPANIWQSPSPEGLGRVLSSVVAEDPARFAAEALAFQGLDPTYVRNLFFGLRDALKKDRTFDWEPVLDLCDWVLSQPREVPGRKVREMDVDPDWGWTRKAIADLLSLGFEDRQNVIPFRLRKRVWRILKLLTDDPDPTAEHEQTYGGSNMDPLTLSINTTRGAAIHAAIRYALWVQGYLKKKFVTKDCLKIDFHNMPEVPKVLEVHLDPSRDPSLAIRATYGRWFPWLVLLDPEWSKTHAAAIFPQDQKNENFFEVAWNTYVTFCRPYNNVWEILQPYYHLAVDRIGIQRYYTRWLADPDEKLAEHLMVFYWLGNLSLDDPLFRNFWEKASDAVRAHALTFIGRSLKQTAGNIESKILNRLIHLWETRFATAKKAQQHSNFEKELAAFGWWFVSAKFDVKWTLKQLYAALKLVHKTEPAYMVLEGLADTAKTEPLLSVKCLRFIAEGDRKGWTIHSNDQHIRRILQQGLQDPSAKQETEATIHYLGSRGFLDFRNLLEGS